MEAQGCASSGEAGAAWGLSLFVRREDSRVAGYWKLGARGLPGLGREGRHGGERVVGGQLAWRAVAFARTPAGVCAVCWGAQDWWPEE